MTKQTISKQQLFVLGLQHAMTMFGQTVLVPYLTGVPVNVALFSAGVQTLIFHFITKNRIPIFLGSSFAYISPMIQVTLYYINEGGGNYQSIQDQINSGVNIYPMIQYQTGGIMLAGLIKILMGFLIKLVGIERVTRFFPPQISGTTILIIGLILQPTQVQMQSSNWTIQIVSLQQVILVRLYMKGFIKIIPIIIGIIFGYIVQAISGIIDFSQIGQQNWIQLPNFILPKFSLHQASLIIPVQFAQAVESIQDVYAVSAITEKELYKDPGLHRTLIGDGIGTMIGGFLGGPANTTYSENSQVLAITKVYNPVVMKIAQVVAIIMQFIPKIGQAVESIPQSVMGGIVVLLFGMISQIGLKTLVNHKVNIEGKNLVIISIMLVLSLGGQRIQIGNFSLEGIGLQVIVGLVLNGIFVLTKASDE